MGDKQKKTVSDFNFTAAMQELEALNVWFQRSDIDLEAALIKLRRGQELVNQCRTRLRELENEFTEIQTDLPPNTTSEQSNTTARVRSSDSFNKSKSSMNAASSSDDELDFDLPF